MYLKVLMVGSSRLNCKNKYSASSDPTTGLSEALYIYAKKHY